MKHSFLLLSLAAIAAASCNNKPRRSIEATNMKDTSKQIENKIMIPVSSCYSIATRKDTVYLKVEVFEHVVTGTLLFKIATKAISKGNWMATHSLSIINLCLKAPNQPGKSFF